MKIWIISVSVFCGMIYSLWLSIGIEDAGIISSKRDLEDPDYYIENMVRRTMDESGEVRTILYADLVEHFPSDDSMDLQQPYLQLYNTAGQPWHIKSETGWVSSGNEVILLHGEVEIWRLDSEQKRIIQALTSELRVLPDDEYAESNEPSIIVHPSAVTHSVGLRANFSHNHLELVREVRSKHKNKTSG